MSHLRQWAASHGLSLTDSASAPRSRRKPASVTSIHDLVDDTPDEELKDVQDEGEASHV
jgi:hypothetical protein